MINYLGITFDKPSFCYMAYKYGDELIFCWYDATTATYLTEVIK